MGMSWLSLVRDALSLVYYAALTVFFSAAYVVVAIVHFIPTVLQYVATTIKFVALPISALSRTVLFVSAPVRHTLRLLFSPLFIILHNVQRLAPLYIFFATAIFIGILTSALLYLTTSTTFTLLDLRDSSTPNPPLKVSNTPLRSSNTNAPPSPSPSPSDFDTTTTDLDALLAGISSSPESDHQLLAALQGAWRDDANTKRKRRSVSSSSGKGLGGGLMGRFGTILEEDDDSL